MLVDWMNPGDNNPDTPVYATDLDANGVRRALAKASKERKPEWRATPRSPPA
jgi:8-hydroxy-5-deazaflavin:NADPH oxidoreductase